ncbi:hypothetical protein [Microbulbifer variabilis]|uniref:hypothetical protein n=1 Tax=Microbulbifer variabilis TaxID=266805 RepID=UPI001CFEF0B4|nr:hypothetical protein [Microbulbifer variabilis]
MTKFAIGLAAVLLAGCSATTNITQKSASEVRQAVTIQNTTGNSAIEYSGPPMQGTTDGSTYNLYYFNLRALAPTDGSARQYQLHIDITYRENWRNYEKAILNGGDQLELSQLNLKTLNCVSSVSCMIEETIEVALSEDQITNALKRREKLRVKLYAKSGHRSVIDVPSSYLMGFYSAIVNRQG